jgi:hypothetical protein
LTGVTGSKGPEGWARLEARLVVLVALHSLAVAGFLLFATEWGVRFGGWGSASPLFFPRQAGIFHVVAALGYLIEYFRYRGVTFLVTTKAIAVVFLLTMTVIDGGPWTVPLSALADGLMGLAILVVHRKARGR